MTSKYFRNFLACLTLVLGTVAGPSALSAQADPKTGTHVVRRGETLRGIAAYYLGDQSFWKEIWELNKEHIPDPDRISPGDVLVLRIPDDIPRQAALVARKNRKVEEQRHPLDFANARINDLLQPLDSIRTGEGASTELRFGDDTSLVLTEQTQVVLGDEPKSSSVRRQQIQIELGQADLSRSASSGPGVDIEIVMGSTVVKPRGGASGDIEARTRRPEGQAQGAQLMVYKGSGDVESAGARVAVDQGMGTTVAEGAAPAPPEKLLDAPQVIDPPPGARLEVADPTFRWEAVEGAESYTLEVCNDPRCAELEVRRTGLSGTSWQASALALRPYYWRVTARSPSGLDGYPSTAADFSVNASTDRVAPQASIRFSGPMVGVGTRLVVGIGAAIEVVDVTDEGSGVQEWTRLLDGQPVSEEAWRSTAWSSGQHVAAVAGVDRSGNRLHFEPQTFLYDPDPPVVHWGVEEGDEIGSASGPSSSEVDPLLEKTHFGLWSRTTGSDLSPLVWTSSKVKWLPMEFGDWTISSDKPFILVRARKKPVTFEPVGETVTKSRGLWIHATDAGCGVESLRYQLYVGPQKQKVLVIEAVDALDNKTRLVWTLD